MSCSIFTDEYGFGSSERGLRYTVALVLPGLRGESEARVHPRLKGAAGAFGLPFHASEANDIEGFRLRLRDWLRPHPDPAKRRVPVDEEQAALVRAEIRVVLGARPLLPAEKMEELICGSLPVKAWRVRPPPHPAALDMLGQMKDRVERALGPVVGQILGDDGLVVMCFEHGATPPDGWTDMMQALIEEALVLIALRHGGGSEVEVEVVPAASGNPKQQFPLDRVITSLADTTCDLAVLELRPSRSPAVVAAEASVGIQAADVIAHCSRPKGAHRRLVADPWSEGFARLHKVTPVHFPPPEGVRARWRPPLPPTENSDPRFTAAGARKTHDAVLAALDALRGPPHEVTRAIAKIEFDLARSFARDSREWARTVASSLQAARALIQSLASRVERAGGEREDHP